MPLATDDAILCDVLDEEGSETIDDTDDVSDEPICPQSSDVPQTLVYFENPCYLVIIEILFPNV